MLQKGADAKDKCDDNGNIALHFAAEYGHIDILKLLLDHHKENAEKAAVKNVETEVKNATEEKNAEKKKEEYYPIEFITVKNAAELTPLQKGLSAAINYLAAELTQLQVDLSAAIKYLTEQTNDQKLQEENKNDTHIKLLKLLKVFSEAFDTYKFEQKTFKIKG